jgi:hypothetical protein
VFQVEGRGREVGGGFGQEAFSWFEALLAISGVFLSHPQT